MKKSLSTFLSVVALCGLCANVYAADAPAMTGMDAAKADTKAVEAKPAETKPTAEPAKVAAPADPLAGVFIAGTAPHQRPENAPVVKEMNKDKAWYDKAVTGVSRPFPWNLKFLENQENWFTPFNRPGMTGKYDIRGWHKG